MGWLKQTEHKIRKSLNTAVENYARYMDGGQKRNILGVNFFLYYSLEYISKLFYYDIKLIINGIKLKKVLSYWQFLKKENNSVVAEESKFRSEGLSYESARQNFLVEYDYQGVAKLQRDYDRQRFSRQEREFSIKKKLSFLEDKLIINTKKASSLLEERNFLENALEDQFFIYEEKWGENALEIAFIHWLKQTERKIRKIILGI
uniref:Uncharacterized protein n=1 Tax=Cyphia tortilis TaxID=2041122 RepID=A0A291F5F8_9ASTR|nr:hypothetical protein Cyp_tor1Pt1135 [Cyphia tortilis]YP_009436982.1 hypothetical protein Cyp_tor1Pt1508 [Cyphia tortilis]ATG27339.1 hypothetical protein Cyp_tor1Pt1135 [Cyphia tortilis]ATG27358.1 hypothetical protein Cyp_tor1Pt1508 [Cyphia tortilis]